MKKVLLIICVMTMLAGCTGNNADKNSLYEGMTEASATETTAVTASPTIETVTEPTTEPPIRQLNSHIKELDLSRIENSEYPRYENEFTYGGEYEMDGWGKIIEDKNIYFETSSGERTELITIPDAHPLSYIKIREIIDKNRFYYSIIDEEFVIGCGVYDLSTGKDFHIDSGEAGYAPLEAASNRLILTRGRKSDLTGYAILDLDNYEITDIDLPEMTDGYHMSCCAVSSNGRAAAGITRSVSEESYEYTVSIVNLQNGKLLSEYSFVSENDYVDFNLRFTSDKELYVYAGQFLYVVSLDDEIADSVTEEIYQNPIEAYKWALQAKDFLHSYTLYDMDKDGIPELLIKYGTSEADFLISVYAYKNGKLRELTDDIPGSHTSFAYDYVANQLVLAQGHMGYGFMTWYDIDENGVLRRLTSTDTLDFNSENGPTYSDYMDKYNVAFLDCSGFFQLGDEKKTWLYSYSSGEYLHEEYEGFDYRLLENYPF